MLAYWRERFPLHLFLPVAIGLAFAAQNGRPSLASATGDVAFALLLLAQCRLWDDLVDRGSDATCHPQRVLVRARSTVPFASTCLFLAGVAMVVVMLRPGSVIAASTLALLYSALGMLYACRTHRSASADLVLLSKYPAIVLIIAAGAPGALSALTFVSMTVVFVGACAYEVWHDEGSPLAWLVRLKPDTTTGVRLKPDVTTEVRLKPDTTARSVQWQ